MFERSGSEFSLSSDSIIEVNVVAAIRADEIARKLMDALPDGLSGLNQDIRRNLRAALSSALQQMELVSREEFDIQRKVLARSRERLEVLENRVQALEIQLKGPSPT